MILLTGSTGYLGSNLLASFIGQGFEIVALKRKQSDTTRWEAIKPNFHVENIDEGSIDALFKKYPIKKVIHTATSYGRKEESLSQILEANILVPLRLIESGKKHGLETFYNTSTSLPSNINTYAKSKYQFQEWVSQFKETLKIIHVVPEYFYGPNDDKIKFVTMLINKMRADHGTIDLSPCTQKRDFFYIDDLVKGFASLIENESKIETNSSYSIGSGKSISLKELVLTIADMMDFDQSRLKFGALPLRENEIQESHANLTKWKNFGWYPQVSLEEGLKLTIGNN